MVQIGNKALENLKRLRAEREAAKHLEPVMSQLLYALNSIWLFLDVANQDGTRYKSMDYSELHSLFGCIDREKVREVLNAVQNRTRIGLKALEAGKD